MGELLIDLGIVATLVIGLTAFLGVIPEAIGVKLFGRNKKNEFVDASKRTQTNWKHVGGTKK